MNRFFAMIFCFFSAVMMTLQAQTVSVDLVSNAASTIDVNYTASGSFPINIWNNQVLTITWPDTGAGGPGNAVSIAVASSNSSWFFNIQGTVNCAANVCSQKVISSSNSVNVDLSMTTSVVTLTVSGQGSVNTTYNISGTSGDLFVNHAILGNVGVAGSAVTLPGSLPVELLDFQAQLTKDNRVWLDWQTASEVNNDYFLVERSRDGQVFEPIDKVAGVGNSYTEIQYESWDEEPLSGLNYYRLKQVDFDGSYDFSQIRVVEFQSTKIQAKVYPNPALEYIQIDFNESMKKGAIRLFDEAGRLVLEQKVSQGTSSERLLVGHMPRGIYYLQLKTAELSQHQKIVLQ